MLVVDTLFTLPDAVTITVDGNNQPVYLYAFGDVHIGAPNHSTSKWKEFLDDAKKTMEKHQVYFICMGDVLELLSTSERKTFMSGKLHESTIITIDNLVRQQADTFVKDISFMKGRLLGILEGNHHYELTTGITSTQYICEKLLCPYLGILTGIPLLFKYKKQNTRMRLDLWACHGKGAAKLIGGSLNRLEDMLRCFEGDIMLMGHDHQRAAGKTERLRLKRIMQSGNEFAVDVEQRTVAMARTGSFLKGYEKDKPSYQASKLYRPSSLGGIKIKMTPKEVTENKKKKAFIDLEVIL